METLASKVRYYLNTSMRDCRRVGYPCVLIFEMRQRWLFAFVALRDTLDTARLDLGPCKRAKK